MNKLLETGFHKRKSFWFLISLLFIISIIELFLLFNQPSEEKTNQLINHAHHLAQKSIVDVLDTQSDDFKTIQENIADLSELNFKDKPYLILVTKSNELLFWSEFLPQELIRIEPKLGVSIYNYPASSFIVNKMEFVSNLDSIEVRFFVPYNVSNPIEFPNLNSLAFNKQFQDKLSFPIQISTQPVQDSLSKQTEIARWENTQLYAISYPSSLSLLYYNWSDFKDKVRSGYLIVLIVFSVFFMNRFSSNWDELIRFLFRIVLYLVFWILTSWSNFELHLTDILIQMGFVIDRSITITLINLNIHTLFFGLISFELIRSIRTNQRFYGVSWYPRTIVLSLVFGALTYLALTSIPASYYHLIELNQIDLHEIDILPSIDLFFFIIGLSASFGLGFLLSVFGNYYLLNSEQDQLSWVYPFHFLSFTSIHFLFTAFGIGYVDEFKWSITVPLLYTFIMILAHQIMSRPRLILEISQVRQLLFAALVLSFLLYPTLQFRIERAQNEELETNAKAIANDYIQFYQKPASSTNLSIKTHDLGFWPGLSYLAVYSPENELVASWNSQNIDIPELKFLQLGDLENKKLKKNSKLSRQLYHEDKSYLEFLFFMEDEGWLVRGVIENISLPEHIYSIFRFFYLSFLLFLLIQQFKNLFNKKSVLLFEAREQFQSRILDTYIITSLVFLLSIVGTTAFLIANEKSKLIEKSVNEAKSRVINAIKNENYPTLDQPYINYLSERYNVNVDVYENKLLILSINPSQINWQSLLPMDAQSELNDEGKVEYQIINTSKPNRSASFVRPKLAGFDNLIMKIQPNRFDLNSQTELMDVVSNLITVYVIVFGLFIIVAFFISGYLAEPLKRLLFGLRRISSGRLDTIVPVTTQDEIGELANAYNFMIFRLKDLQKELAEVERQAAWTEMARQVAHEIKNPLTPMKLSLQHLQRMALSKDVDSESFSPNFKEISNRIIEQIDSLSHIASDFSKFAKPITDELEETDLNTLLLEIHSLYQHDEFIKISLDLSSEPLKIMGVPEDLKRVFINMMKNAIESMENGGSIYINSYPYKNEAVVEIADTGSGIPVDIQHKIFDPNFSSKTSGTGIGLAICKKVIESHHGRIDFASVPNSGTTFTLSLPLIQEKS